MGEGDGDDRGSWHRNPRRPLRPPGGVDSLLASDLATIHSASLSLARALAIDDVHEAEDAVDAIVLRLSVAERRLDAIDRLAKHGTHVYPDRLPIALRAAVRRAARDVLGFLRHPDAPDVIALVPLGLWSVVVKREAAEVIGRPRAATARRALTP